MNSFDFERDHILDDYERPKYQYIFDAWDQYEGNYKNKLDRNAYNINTLLLELKNTQGI